MKIKIKIEQEIEIASIRIRVPVRYEEQDIPYDFPLRKGDVWDGEVEMDTGRIKGWPKGKSGRLAMKVCDEGTYTLLDKDGKTVARRKNDYVPDAVPGEYGDYIDLKINSDGVVTNWPKRPDFKDFFGKE